MRWLRGSAVVFCVAIIAICIASGVRAQPPALETRLATLERAPEASLASEPIRQARRALQRERQLRTARRSAAADRARRIADAAVILAERIVARARAEASLRDVIAERDEALRRRAVAEEALERSE